MAQVKKRKRFFNVEIPLINRETQLQAYEINELEGRFMKYDLTRMLRGKSMLLSLKVSVNDEKAVAIPRSLQLMPYFLKRMVRKGTNYVEDSFLVNCKNAQIRIKPFLITRRKVPRVVRKALRFKAKEELTKYIEDKKSEELFEGMVNNQIQKSLSLKLKKIYPLSLCEIRVFKVEKELKDEENTSKKSVEKSKEEIKKEDKKE